MEIVDQLKQMLNSKQLVSRCSTLLHGRPPFPVYGFSGDLAMCQSESLDFRASTA
ncbi:hypothetical protein M404DRAFT_995809 [Pisolithus tinctorius Marx 270]|uniref:Uncharacterized protein n=1 Tax=Pisolithus tinctorius Marx 270 TaxID=870435 RepID=A0A0C3P8M0_PISTI|nr:hypothetical protein M404DRAFT_995809 [Pisolithus tinctorius Marx 270]